MLLTNKRRHVNLVTTTMSDAGLSCKMMSPQTSVCTSLSRVRAESSVVRVLFTHVANKVALCLIPPFEILSSKTHQWRQRPMKQPRDIIFGDVPASAISGTVKAYLLADITSWPEVLDSDSGLT